MSVFHATIYRSLDTAIYVACLQVVCWYFYRRKTPENAEFAIACPISAQTDLRACPRWRGDRELRVFRIFQR